MTKFSMKRNKPASRRSLPTTSKTNTPVMRYYRPAQNSTNRPKLNKKDYDSSDKSSDHSLKRFFHLVGQWAGVLLIVFVLVANTGINDVGVHVVGSDQQYRSANTYTQGMEEILKSSILYRNKLTLSSADIEDKVRAKFPEISAVTAVIPLAGRRLQINVEYSKPLARLLVGGNQQAVISEQGYVIQIETAEKINSKFKNLPSLSIPNLKVQSGDRILTGVESGLITLASREFDGSNDNRPAIESIEYEVLKREMKVRFSGKNFFAKLTPERDSRLQIGSLVATMKNATEKGIAVSEYLDVRVDGRVYLR